MSVRATNVYEERSLGIFGNRAQQEHLEEPKDAEVFSKYLGWHIRHQLSFDIWWLAAALLVLNIVEVCRLELYILSQVALMAPVFFLSFFFFCRDLT
jgi:hypothetical protein